MRSYNPHQVYTKICDVLVMLERIQNLADVYNVSEISVLSRECIAVLREALKLL